MSEVEDVQGGGRGWDRERGGTGGIQPLPPPSLKYAVGEERKYRWR
jgi:hypothetical protein